MPGWVMVGLGVAALALGGFAWRRGWSPPRWGGRHQLFALVMTGLGVAIGAFGGVQLTGGPGRVVLQLLAVAGFLFAAGNVLRAQRDAGRP